MSIEVVHEYYVKNRRVRVLSEHLSALLPENASVLDIGAGDGNMARAIMDLRSDVSIVGIDLLVREDTATPVEAFDGSHIPYEAGSFDFAMFVDVLHHTEHPMGLLREAVRVARAGLLIKDHCLEGLAAETTLRFMDRVGNARFGVNLPHNYWTQAQWDAAVADLHLSKDPWHTKLDLYPWWADWLFGRQLHFIAKLTLPDAS